jgi:formylglycine-generating enzyme required for sulfatase activity
MNVEMDPKLCLVLIPTSDESIQLYEDVIKPTITGLGLSCSSADELLGPRPVVESVWEHCEKARVIIAELTGCDPSVFYQAGYSHAFDSRKVIFITQDITQLPFDVGHFQCIVYDPRPRGIKKLKSWLKQSIEAVLAEEPQPPRRETEEALVLYDTIQALERGEPPPFGTDLAGLLKVLAQVEGAPRLPLEEIRTEPGLPSMVTVKDVPMVYVPSGRFLMGSDKGRRDEKPPHTVYVDSFYIARYPVTNAQYEEFVVARGHRLPTYWKEGTYPRGKGHHPVVYVSWHDALAYCEWLSEETGEEMRLPTEAEWEKAARGTEGREYPWGDEFDKSRCNARESDIGGTTPVGRYSPRGDSPYAVADMIGNVWEWTSSLHRPYPYDPTDGREDLEAEGNRVLRGGSWLSDQDLARCAVRLGGHPEGLLDLGGFRCAKSAPE